MRRIAAAFASLGLLIVASGCSSDPAPGPADCPVTTPAPDGSLPSGLSFEDDAGWHGSGALWVDLDNFTAPITAEDGVLRVKDAWWTGDGSGEPESGEGPPDVRAQPFGGGDVVEGSSGGYAAAETEGGTLSWWPTTVDLPAAGCWEITGEWEGETTIAVVLITDAADG